MNLEVERKFLVTRDGYSYPRLPALFRTCVEKRDLMQGYLHEGKPTTRVRTDLTNKQAWLCIKTSRDADTHGKQEFEYEIPFADGRLLILQCGTRVLSKTRYNWVKSPSKACAGFTIEIDFFTSPSLRGLVIAEIEKPAELSLEEFLVLKPPKWCGEEVTGVKGWSNRQLVMHGIPKQKD